jgi:hypothetical protein
MDLLRNRPGLCPVLSAGGGQRTVEFGLAGISARSDVQVGWAATNGTVMRSRLHPLWFSPIYLATTLHAQGGPIEVCGRPVSPSIAPNGVGPVVLGTSVVDVLAQCQGIFVAPVTSPDFPSADTLLGLAINAGHGLLGVVYRDSTVIRIIIQDSSFHTADSLHVGTLFARLRRRPGLTVRLRHGFVWATVLGRCSPRFVLGTFDQRLAESDTVLSQAQVPDSMPISALWVSACHQ